MADVFTLKDNVKTLSKSLNASYEKDNTMKFKSLALICYDEEELKLFLANTQPYSWAWILHDKDVKDDGSPKEKHYHCIVKYDCGIRVTVLAKAFSQNVFIEIPFNDEACKDYLTHKNHPKKYQYSLDDVTSFTEEGRRFFYVSKEEFNADKNSQMLADLDTLSYREMFLKYGQNFMINYKKMYNFVADMKADDEYRELQKLESEYCDFSLFTQYGVDYRQYCLQANGELLVFLADRLGNLNEPCTMDLLRGLLVEFQRTEIMRKRAYLRSHLLDAFDVAMDKVNEGLVADDE